MKRIDDITIIEEGINKAAKKPQEGWIVMEISSDEYRQASYKDKKDICNTHLEFTGKRIFKSLPGLLESLMNFENLLYATKKFYRDHVFHTFRVWGLGLYLYYNGLCKFIDKKERSHFHFTWYLASVYHDIGYPVSGLRDLIEHLDKCFMYTKFYGSFNFDGAIKPLPYDNNDLNVLKKLLPSEEVDSNMLEQRHGLIGALLLLSSLKSIHFNPPLLSEDAHPAIKAIGEHDGWGRISFRESPVSALLVICDELQEWGRPYISTLLEERYVTTDHIELEMGSDGSTPRITARIDYTKNQSELEKILGWEGESEERIKGANLKRLTGIDVDVDMVYNRI